MHVPVTLSLTPMLCYHGKQYGAPLTGLWTFPQHLPSLIFEAAGSRTAKGNRGGVFWARCTSDISFLFIWLFKAPACTCKCRWEARLEVRSWALLPMSLTFSLMSLWRFIQFVQFNLPTAPPQKKKMPSDPQICLLLQNQSLLWYWKTTETDVNPLWGKGDGWNFA